MNHPIVASRKYTRVSLRRVTALACVLVMAIAVFPVRADEVTYQFSADGVIADLTLSDYTPGTPLTISDFVLFTLNEPFDYKIEPAHVTLLEGSIDLSGATPDVVDLRTDSGLDEFLENSATGEFEITVSIEGSGGKGSIVSKFPVLGSDDDTWSPVPEPASIELVLLGAAAMIAIGLFRIRAKRTGVGRVRTSALLSAMAALAISARRPRHTWPSI